MTRLTEDLNGYYGKAEQYIDCDDRAWVGAVINKLGILEDLGEDVGCPLDVRCEVVPNSYIYTFGTSMLGNEEVSIRRKVITISKEGIYISYATVSREEREMILSWDEYKKTWWLKEDRSE